MSTPAQKSWDQLIAEMEAEMERLISSTMATVEQMRNIRRSLSPDGLLDEEREALQTNGMDLTRR